MELYKQIVLYFMIVRMRSLAQKKGALPFPPLTNFTKEDIDKPFFEFEGVDYEALPENLKRIYTDCIADYVRCSRQVTYHHPVCGYDTYYWRYRWFQSYCELEYQNCKDTHIKDRRFHVMGDGWWCEYTRR